MAIIVVLIQSINSQPPEGPRWLLVEDLNRVQIFTDLVRPDIINVLKVNRYNIHDGCIPTVTAAEQMVCFHRLYMFAVL